MIGAIVVGLRLLGLSARATRAATVGARILRRALADDDEQVIPDDQGIPDEELEELEELDELEAADPTRL